MTQETPNRVNVANILTAVVTHGHSLDDALDAMRAATPASEAAFIQECVYGVLRRIFQLKWRLKSLLKTPLRARDAVIEMLLLAGLYELDAMQTPPYAVVDQSVTACAILGREWAKRLVNAILRGALRQANTVAAAPPEEVHWNHPQWLIDTLKQAWPADWEHVLTANHARAPLTLRVNRQRGTRAAYLDLLAAQGIPAQATRFAPDGVQLLEPRSVADLPGFDSGHVSVQDEAAQLAGPLLDCDDGQRVLDACMAPGGKASHLLELNAGIALTALERSARRALVAKTNFARLGLACPILTADVFDFVQDSAAPDYARILLDAPCTATGVIRRHPDIKLHRQAADVTSAAANQLALLQALWPRLAPGGRLLYATCSVLREENDAVVAAFADHAPESVKILPIAADWGHATAYGRQILPGQDAMDGFYYALLEKPPLS